MFCQEEHSWIWGYMNEVLKVFCQEEQSWILGYIDEVLKVFCQEEQSGVAYAFGGLFVHGVVCGIAFTGDL